ncbi:MAG: hypothetical protein PHR82_08170 [Endomicrobiaceae bacterium]|nr:hypothetical protein [Endomicrobiaceae bacterium]
MKKVLSLLLVLGCVVLFSQIASAAIKGTYTAEVNVSGSFSFEPSLVLTSNYTTAAGTITWSSWGDAYASTDNWQTASVAVKVAVTNQKAGTTVQLYQDNTNVSNGVYQSSIPYYLAGGSITHAGLVKANSGGGNSRFTLGYKVTASTTPVVTVVPLELDQTNGLFMKDKSDTGFVSDSAYYTILSDQGFLSYIQESGAGGFTPFTSGTLYIHFGANFRDATAGVYGTKSVTLESFNE